MTENMTEELQDQALAAVRKSHEMTLETVKKIVQAMSAATAHLPASPFADKLSTNLPFADKLHGLPKLPEPGTVVASVFDFAGELLAEQRKFADELVKATTTRRHAAAGTDAPPAPDAE